MNVKLKRAYDPVSDRDGTRVLVDRLWPRGLSKEKGRIDHWMKGIAPSEALRKWFGHDPEKWAEFQQRYRMELDGQKEVVDELATLVKAGPVTLVFAAKDEARNNAVALREHLRSRR